MTHLNPRGQLDTAFNNLVADMNRQLAQDFPEVSLHHGPKALDILAETARQADQLLDDLQRLVEAITGQPISRTNSEVAPAAPSATLPAVVAFSRRIGAALDGASAAMVDLRRHL